MKRGLVVVLSVLASPAFAHHEVVVASSMVPLVCGVVAIQIAAIAAWRKRRKK